LNFLHLAGIKLKLKRTSHQQVASIVKAFLQRPQADRVTLSLTGDQDAKMLRHVVLGRPSPLVHRLEIEDIHQLLQTTNLAAPSALPDTLGVIVVCRTPRSDLRGPAAMQQVLTPQPDPAVHALSLKPRTVTVYISDGRADGGLLEVQDREAYGQ
jgi:hypothetical protein